MCTNKNIQDQPNKTATQIAILGFYM